MKAAGVIDLDVVGSTCEATLGQYAEGCFVRRAPYAGVNRIRFQGLARARRLAHESQPRFL